MELKPNKFGHRCEMGGCRNKAEFSLTNKRFGRRYSLHMCKECLGVVYAEIGKVMVPNSPRNLFGKSAQGVMRLSDFADKSTPDNVDSNPNLIQPKNDKTTKSVKTNKAQKTSKNQKDLSLGGKIKDGEIN